MSHAHLKMDKKNKMSAWLQIVFSKVVDTRKCTKKHWHDRHHWGHSGKFWGAMRKAREKEKGNFFRCLLLPCLVLRTYTPNPTWASPEMPVLHASVSRTVVWVCRSIPALTISLVTPSLSIESKVRRTCRIKQSGISQWVWSFIYSALLYLVGETSGNCKQSRTNCLKRNS